MAVTITGSQLTIEDIEAVARRGEPVRLHPDALARIVTCRAFTPSAFAMTRQIAAFAFPASAGALTRTLRRSPIVPAIASRDAPGTAFTRIRMSSPSG